MSFDCYGTLIDWETGIINALRPILVNHGIERSDEEILTVFSDVETVIQQPPYKRYRDVLAGVADEFAARWDFELTDDERASFATSVVDWPAFPDSPAGLAELAKHYDLIILSNVDDDLFAASARKLGVEFADIITAEQVGSYKPDPRNFETLLTRIDVPKEALLHTAQSLYHDVAPANRFKLTSIWVNRRSVRPDAGAAPHQEAQPDLEVPDLATLAEYVREAFGA